MEEYPSNSRRSKEGLKSNTPAKKAEKVVTGDVTIKKNEVKKFAGTFFAEDISTVASYIWEEIVVPSIKDIFFNSFTNGLDKFLYGRDGGRKKSQTSKSSYSDYYRSDKDRHIIEEPRTRSRFDYDDIVLRTRGDAERVLAEMDDYITRYKVVSVLDLYDMLGHTAPYTADRYGWADIRGAHVRPVRGGYKLEIPKPMPLD